MLATFERFRARLSNRRFRRVKEKFFKKSSYLYLSNASVRRRAFEECVRDVEERVVEDEDARLQLLAPEQCAFREKYSIFGRDIPIF